MSDINIEVLINLLKDSVGIEAAEKIIYQTIKEMGLPTKTIYSKDEYQGICEALKKRGGFVKTIATIASTSSFHNIYYQRELAKEKKEKEDLARWNEALERKVREKTKELKEAQAQLIQSAKMGAIGQLGAGIAHELNNPLACILGYAQFILQKMKKPDFSRRDIKIFKRYLEDIEEASKRCKNIVEDLLTFTHRPERGAEKLNIKELLGRIVSLMESRLKMEKIKLKVRFSDDSLSVWGEANLLQQAFINIIINAQEAMPRGGRLNIYAKSTDSEIAVAFEDTGYGIPEDSLEKIFEPFFTTKQAQKALGLGLLICYQIVKQHKGRVEVKSRLKKGSAFTIILPKAE